MKYLEIKNQQVVMEDCFFAFNDEQLAAGMKEHNIKKEDLRSAEMNLYGTTDGIKKLMSFYDEQYERIRKECDPQEVYEYEFNIHECGYLHDDTEAIKIVVAYFGEERAKLVKRHNGCAYVDVDVLFNT